MLPMQWERRDLHGLRIIIFRIELEMDIVIEIGREVEGANVYQIPSTYKRTSRHHADLHWHDGVATLVDKSSNGTYVNGRRITQTQIKEGDIVWLGGIATDDRCYKLDVERVFAICREKEASQRIDYSSHAVGTGNRCHSESDNFQRTDYTKEFALLKKTYIDYHEQLSKLKSKSITRMQLPRLLLSLIPAVLGVIFMFVLGFGGMGFIAMMLGSVLSGVIGTLTMGRNTSRQEKLSEDILDLQLKYQKDYKCPKCGKPYSLDLHWKKLQADGKCPFGCGAEFV